MKTSKLYARMNNRIKNMRVNENLKNFYGNNGLMFLEKEKSILPEVVISCFNQGVYLEEALTSIYSSGYTGPVTIVNDCSTDNTGTILEKIKSKYNIKIIVNNKNLGQSGSINKAIEQSVNNFFIMLNADDCLLKYSIRLLTDIAKNNESVRMIGGGSLPFTHSIMLQFNDILPESLNYDPYVKVVPKGHALSIKKPNDINMTMSSSAFFRSAWQTVGGFFDFKNRVCSYDDRDFQLRVNLYYDIAIVEEPLAFYRTSSSLGLGEFT